MERNVVKSNVVNASATLVDQEHYVVGMDGVKTEDVGDFVYGVVSHGRPANEASEVIVGGECDAYVDGSSTAIAAEDPLTGCGTTGGASADGVFVKATIGTHKIRAYAKEAASTLTTIEVMLV